MNQPSRSDGQDRPKGDDKFLLIAGALLLLIIALLGGLWLGMRARAQRAELQFQQAQADAAGYRTAAEGGKIMLSQFLSELRVPRSLLTTQPATLDGQSVTVLRLPAPEGKLLGFEPGDVIMVQKETATASAPSERTGP